MEKNRHTDNLFRKILEEHPDFEIPKADIEDMRHRLDATEKPTRRRGFLYWLLPLLFIPIFLGLGYLFTQNQKLKTQIQSLQNNLTNVNIDSIEQRNITYVFDTIYHTINKEVIVQKTTHTNGKDLESSYNFSNLFDKRNDSAFLFSKNPYKFFRQSNSPYNNISTNIFLLNTFDLSSHFHSSENQSKDDLLNKHPENLTNTLERPINIFSIQSLVPFIDKKENRLKTLGIEEANTSFKKRRRNPLYHLRPKGLHLGISYSPLGLATLSGINSTGITNFGLTSEIFYNKNLRLGIGVQLTRFNVETNDPVRISALPTNSPDNPNDVLKDISFTLNQLQIPFSLKYLFYKNRKLTPFISGGFAASRATRQSFKTEFISISLSEYSKTLNLNDGIFSIKNIRGAFGLEYDFNSNWAASAETFYYHDLELNSGEYFLLRNLGLNLSLKKKW